MNSMSRRIAITGVLFALAMALSYAESTLSLLFLLPPGVKLGLANIVIMYCLLFAGPRYALSLVLLKSAFALITRGAIAALLSLSGGALSFITLLILLYVFKQKTNYFITSVSGAIAHNLGQLLALSLFFNSAYTFYYAPVLLISGLAAGTVTSLTLRALIPTLSKLNLF